MIYDSLVKKVEKFDREPEGFHKYYLEFSRSFFWFFLPILILFISTLNIYLLIVEGFNVLKLVLNIFLILMSIYNIRVALKHRTILDFDSGLLIIEGQDIKLADIKGITLKHMVIPGGKAFNTCLIIITNDKKEFIAPIYTGKKVEFIGFLKAYFKDKFKITKKS